MYAAKFVCGTSFDYRLVFLALCVPWLWAEGVAGESARSRRLRWVTGSVLLAFVWINPVWWLPLMVARELCGWTLLALLCWWLGKTFDVTDTPRAACGAATAVSSG